MKFTDGFWLARPGVDALYAQQAYDIRGADGAIVITAPTKVIAERGDTLNRPVLSVRLRSPLPGVIGVTIEHFTGGERPVGFDLPGAEAGHGVIVEHDDTVTLTSGDLTARIGRGSPWSLAFESGDRTLTASGRRSVAYLRVGADAAVEPPPVGGLEARPRRTSPTAYLHEQLELAVGEHIYGLGERFGPLVKNGQTVDIWNADGGTSSEQSYKSVPFYISDRGYGVLVNHAGHVSFEVGSEAVERVQFSVEAERMEYFVIAGDPKTVLERYTRLTGRPASVPAWSYGLWLSTSFTTDYDEATVTRFVEGMAERDIPLSVFHFDCFWMREFQWSDLEWDSRTFPDPEGMLARLHDRGLRVSVWINPYIAQRSVLFDEAQRLGYLVRRVDGAVWQWDLWQPGMALIDFTNPAAIAWFQEKLRALLRQGVDCFKTDFGERIPLDVVYSDGSDPEAMHHVYTQLYNQAVFDVLEGERGAGEAVLFARSATVGGHRMPVHWGGDSTSTFASMAETLRGGLSLAMSGFGFWSHDIGGFEGHPDAAVFKRWTAFGMLSSHSRLHGSDSYRVPWAFDDEAVEVTRSFTHLKLRLMPYLVAAGAEASATGTPVMRPMALEFAGDPAVTHLDRQYMLGPDLLVAPVFSADGTVDVYLPAGRWTSLLTGEQVTGGSWRRETHGMLSLPLYVREGAVLPLAPGLERAGDSTLDRLVLEVYPAPAGSTRQIVVDDPDGRRATFDCVWTPDGIEVSGTLDTGWSARLPGGDPVEASGGRVSL